MIPMPLFQEAPQVAWGFGGVWLAMLGSLVVGVLFGFALARILDGWGEALREVPK